MSTKPRKAARKSDKETQALISLTMEALKGAVADMLRAYVHRCDECGWSGVVLEYLPMFAGMKAFGENGICYCPECGEDFRERSA